MDISFSIEEQQLFWLESNGRFNARGVIRDEWRSIWKPEHSNTFIALQDLNAYNYVTKSFENIKNILFETCVRIENNQ